MRSAAAGVRDASPPWLLAPQARFGVAMETRARFPGTSARSLGKAAPPEPKKKSQNQTFKIESRFGQTTADRAGCEAVGGAPVQSSEARSRPRDILRPHTRVARRRACAQLRLPPIRSARGRRAQGRTSGACSSPAGGALCATASFGAAQRSSRPVRRASAHRAPP